MYNVLRELINIRDRYKKYEGFDDNNLNNEQVSFEYILNYSIFIN